MAGIQAVSAAYDLSGSSNKADLVQDPFDALHTVDALELGLRQLVDMTVAACQKGWLYACVGHAAMASPLGRIRAVKLPRESWAAA